MSNVKTEVLSAKVTLEMKHAVRSLADDLDCTISKAVAQAIEYGILYYYYVKEDD